MAPTPLVAIGGSAGALQALQNILPTLRPQADLAYALVLHRQPLEEDLRLERVLASRTRVQIVKPRDGEAIERGTLAVCPAGVHLTVVDGHYVLDTGPKVNRVRPSVDVLFRSVGRDFGNRCAGIVLSGVLDDGAAGIAYMRSRGALTIAQDPDEAVYSDMPRNAIAAGAEFVARYDQIASALERLEAAVEQPQPAIRGNHEYEHPSTITCPDCHGVLWERERNGIVDYRCRVGHAYSPQTLETEKHVTVEDALWTAIQVLEEQADLSRRAAQRARLRGDEAIAVRISARAAAVHTRAQLVKRALESVRSEIATTELLDQESGNLRSPQSRQFSR
jgi:two-component system, chemotaxis family, protein-glutamate methylesterase/glutaminase